MPSDFYRRRMQAIADMHLPPEEALAECIASLATGLDQLREEIQGLKDLVVHNERTRRGLRP